ncbi:hypothetical protein D6853_12410 [Butyrivibrio sp. X503]|uniref:hypothetical protein n=1 Tax=Butyrivibrio sp. X503 TaxID=2364878 RepID=UPI000EA929A2|nr:hypothetical protein [Butyrivibrio sp. X503]RKM54637.1 hypothetical protein D6853_12410 [Butyrivibrio sp. X503]
MRKRAAIIILVAVMSLSGCGEVAGTGSRNLGGSKSVNDVLEEQMAKEEEFGPYADDSASEPNNNPDTSVSSAATSMHTAEYMDDFGDTIDLTGQSSTMTYSVVFNMVFYPENFVGKKVKLEGLFSEMYVESKDKRYFACFVPDAAACCAQGIEFEPTDDYKYPDDFPKDSDEITVEGVFDTYDEDGEMYCTLRNAKFTKKNSN